MIRILVLTLVLLTFLYFLFKKESFQTNVVSIEDKIMQEEEEEEQEEEQIQEDEIAIAIKNELDEINNNIQPILNYKKSYDNYSHEFESYGKIDFGESQKTMYNKNDDIPIENPIKSKPFPSRKNEHTWDYTGVHKIEDRGDCYKGIDSALNKRNPKIFEHPVTFQL
jgi:hypothetical protein